nr:DUF2726 domain-containing protein [Sansalvadorimonas sp. 2012CJ34-2]
MALLIYFLLRSRALKTLYLQDPLFDGPVRSFYGLLDVAVREHFNLFRNVGVQAVIRSSGAVSPLPGKLRHSTFDILLCDRRKMMPKCGIVLVEKGDADSREFNQLRKFCDRVSLPLLVYETGGILDVSRLRRDVYQATGLGEKLGSGEVLGDSRGADQASSTAEAVNEEHSEVDSAVAHEVPQVNLQDSDKEDSVLADDTSKSEKSEQDRVCSKCGSGMSQRTIAKGQYAGQQAWVCEQFPHCRHAVLIKKAVAV